MPGASIFFCSLHQCIRYLQTGNCRIFDWCIFFACPFHADRTGCDHNITAFYFRLHSTAGSDPDKCICSAAYQFFQCNCCRRSSNSCRCHTDFLTIQHPRISRKLPVTCNQNRIFQIFRYLFTSSRVSRHDHITSDFTFGNLNMILSAYIF